jgi:hypothetical protein
MRTRAGLLTRIEKLETRVAARSKIIRIRLGYVKRLPCEYQGERHIVIARHLPNKGNQEWVEFEEVPGQAPASPKEDRFDPVRYIDVRVLSPHPPIEEGAR